MQSRAAESGAASEKVIRWRGDHTDIYLVSDKGHGKGMSAGEGVDGQHQD